MKWNSERMTLIIWEKFIKDRQYWYRLQSDQNAITELLRRQEKDRSLVKLFQMIGLILTSGLIEKTLDLVRIYGHLSKNQTVK